MCSYFSFFNDERSHERSRDNRSRDEGSRDNRSHDEESHDERSHDNRSRDKRSHDEGSRDKRSHDERDHVMSGANTKSLVTFSCSSHKDPLYVLHLFSFLLVTFDPWKPSLTGK